jgi:hypothetical protein
MLIRYLLPTVLLASMALAQDSWLEFNAGASENSSPLVQFNGKWDEFLTFDIELRGLLAETVTVDSQEYLRFSKSPGTVPADSVGYPELPVVRRLVWIPDDSDITVDYSASCCEGIECLPVYPTPLDSLVSDSTCTPYIGEYFRQDSAAYASEEWYPDTLARLVGEFRLRDLRVGIVDVYPVQYLASEDSLRVWSDIEVSLSWDAENAVWSQVGLGHYDNLIGDSLLGYTPEVQPINDGTGSVERVDAEDLIEGPGYAPDYVILVAAGLDGQAVTALADHRDDLNGFKVAIVRTDDVLECYGEEETVLTSSMIREFTEDMWDWGEGPGDRPTYLLLIGDHEDEEYAEEDWFLPTHLALEGDPCWYWANDSWYVLFDEDLSVLSAPPDMIVGRLPARDTDNLGAMVDVITDFEEPASWPPSSSLAWRRYLTRLSGQNVQSSPGGPPVGYRYDIWEPDAEWTSDFADWLGYDFDNLNCGDGDDEDEDDGSDVTAHEWVETLVEWFERGQQVAFYSNHGETHMFSAGLQWEADPPMIVVPTDFGVPDSVFDVEEAAALGFGTISHAHPFVISLSCLNGTFNHTLEQHEYSDGSGGHYECMHFDTHHEPPHWDYGTDCLAETWVKNTAGGAIGVFASSEVSNTGKYDLLGTCILQAMYEEGITRQGDAICAGRLACLDQYVEAYTPGGWSNELGRFNLMGDPAVDIGDRVKFPNRCDLVIAPSDLTMNSYPTMSIGGEGAVGFSVIVHNHGAASSGPFHAELDVQWGQQTQTLATACQGLAPGAEATLRFDWHIPQGFTTPATLSLHATADPDGDCPDSWTANNDALVVDKVLDLYPNADGWPVQTPGSVQSPPCLSDLDGDGDLEIVVLSGSAWLRAYEPDGSLKWSMRTPSPVNQGNAGEIFASASVHGTTRPEVVVDCFEEICVFDGGDGDLLYYFEHDTPGLSWSNPHDVVLADMVAESPRETPQDEIAFTCNGILYLLRVQNGQLQQIDSEALPSGMGEPTQTWVAASDLDGSAPPELVVTMSEAISQKSLIALYGYRNSQWRYYSTHLWNGENYNAIPAVGSLASEMAIALPRRTSTQTHYPAFILDPEDLSANPVNCQPTNEECSNILCCMMADWASAAGLDRVISPAENQSFVWVPDGNVDWSDEYGTNGDPRPPFGALGDLDSDEDPDLLVGTRSGAVMAYNSGGSSIGTLGFPYTLPAEVCGGFCIANLDDDDTDVEVIFGTMDGYLQVWELGECDEGYAPWPQVQQDAARTGVLE